MAFTKTKTALAVAAFAAVPLGLQWHENQELKDTIAGLERQGADVENSGARAGLAEPEAASGTRGTVPSPSTIAEPGGSKATGNRSNWPGDPDTFTIPRALLSRVSVSAADAETLLIGDKMATILELTPEETEVIETGLKDLRQRVWDHERDTVKVREIADGKQAYFIPSFPDEGAAVEQQIEDLAKSVLGEDRAEFFLHQFNTSGSLKQRTFSRYGEYGRLVEFTHNEDVEDSFGIRTTYYPGDQETNHTMQESGSHKELPVEYRHLFNESFEEGE